MLMANNMNFQSAKNAKNDEFYTQYSDIEAEMNAYVEYNPDVFRNKTILLPCDDPEWSNFTKYFANNFERFGIKKLISTSYAKGAGNKQVTIFELTSPLYDESKHDTHGKLFTLTRDTDGSGNIDTDDVEFSEYLNGDGDFRSEEVTALRDEADIIITNPPFSLFVDFFNWVSSANKSFLFIGNMNNITYRDIFPIIKDNQAWLGCTHPKEFIIPENNENRDNSYIRADGKLVAKFGNTCWFTNIEHGYRHELLQLDTMEHNLKYNKTLRKYFETLDVITYPTYVNYDAIEVKYTDAIPIDYSGIMGVSISFLDKYNPEQFEIIGNSLELCTKMSQIANKGEYMPGGVRPYIKQINGQYKYKRLYDRLFIRRKQA